MFFSRFTRGLLLLVGLIASGLLVGQDIRINLTTPMRASICGPDFVVSGSIINDGPASLTSLTGSFTGIPGVGLLSASTPQGTYSMGSFNFNDLPAGDTIQFTATFQVNCSVPDESFSVTFSANGNYEQPDGTGGTMIMQASETFTSESIEVVFADLSMPSSSPEVLPVEIDSTSEVTVQVVNNSFGEVEEFYYCVINTLPNLRIDSLKIGDLDILTSTPAFSQGGQDCYLVPNSAIPDSLGNTFSRGEAIDVDEFWFTTACVSGDVEPRDITRRVQYGCEADNDCQEKPTGDFINTGVSYDLLNPSINVTTVSATRPACYIDEPTEVVIRLVNTGNAPARNIRFRIEGDNGRGMTLDTSTVAVYRPTNGIKLDRRVISSLRGNGCNVSRPESIRRADYVLEDIYLQPNDTLLVAYNMLADCGCNNCDIRNKYVSLFTLRSVDDSCGEELPDGEREYPSPRYDAFIGGFVEAPPSLSNGESGCINYSVTRMQLDWLTNQYGDSYLEARFRIPAGLDYQDGTATFTDYNGDPYPFAPGYPQYVDNPGATDDTLVLRWLGPDKPSNFAYRDGADFEYCVVTDCSEKPSLRCADASTDVFITSRFDFTSDEDCSAPCAVQKIWQPDSVRLRVICPSIAADCECDGLRSINFDIERINVGYADENNDQIPDLPLRMADRDTDRLRIKRFVRGDSLRASFRSVVQDVDNNRDFDYAYIEFPLPSNEFAAIGASVTITPVGVGSTPIICGGVPFLADNANNRIIVDLSIPVLQSLGCGLPMGYTYDNGDIIEVNLDFSDDRSFTTNNRFRTVEYEPAFFVSETEFGMGARFQCNRLLTRLTQVALTTGFDVTNNDFGSCDLPDWTVRYDRFIGSDTQDEFPREIRPVGLPETFVFYKPAEFKHRIDAWNITFEQRITPANQIVNSNADLAEEYFTIEGDKVTFFIGNYLRNLGNPEIQPDEGYRVYIRPKIQGGCSSTQDDYDYSFQLTERVNPLFYANNVITRPLTERTFTYTGTAVINVIANRSSIRLCSAEDATEIIVRNEGSAAAANTFLFPEPTGDILIGEVRDAVADTVIPVNNFGIYEIGDIPGGDERVLTIAFTKNICEDASIDFIGGWDCEEYPQTILDAECTDVSSVQLTSASSQIDMLVTQPAQTSTNTVDLCERLEFKVDVLSSDLGFVRDMILEFNLPPNIEYESGTFLFAFPSEDRGGMLRPVPDPTPVGNGVYQIDLSALDARLDSEGLPGSKEIRNSAVTFAFSTEATCGLVSGQRASFTLRSRNSCGNPLRPVRRRSGRISTRVVEKDIAITINPIDLRFNPCTENQQTIAVASTLEGSEVEEGDSIRVLLPRGLNYVTGTFVPGANLPNTPGLPILRVIDGQQALYLPLPPDSGGAGTTYDFTFDVEAEDVAQACGDYVINATAFATVEDNCRGEVCTSSETRGSATATVTIEKPNISVEDLSGTIELTPAEENADVDLSFEVTNLGFLMPAGNSISVGIYDDVNDNGQLEPTIDILLFRIDTTLDMDLITGSSITVTGSTTLRASEICTIIAVVEPTTTCTCTERASATFRPEIVFDFPGDVEVCSGDQVEIGPEAVPGFTSEWFATGGSNLDLLSRTDTTPVIYTAFDNITTEIVQVEFDLRTSNAPCFSDDRVTISVLPNIQRELRTTACLGSSFTLPTTAIDSASNFVWTPAAGLTISEGGRLATIDSVQANGIYTLTYDIGENNCGASLVVYVTVEDCGSSDTQVGDYVWFDLNLDGIQDPDEPGVSGVTVFLLDGNTGLQLSTDITDANGYYLFDELPAGSYAVQVFAPEGFRYTTPDAGGDDALDSDVDAMTGITPRDFVELDSANLNFDAGLIPNCELDLELTVGECVVSGDQIARRLQLSATWANNPYAYDQFGDGNDTLMVTIGSNTYELPISELNGTIEVFDSLVAEPGSATYSITAAFVESSTCEATTMAGPFDPCIYDLALIKVASTIKPTPAPYTYGDLVCMDIIVYNQGLQPVIGVQVLDQLPAGMEFNRPESDLRWNAVGKRRLYEFPDTIAAGASDTVTLCANVIMSSGGEDAYTNIAEIINFEDINGDNLNDFDEDSTPDQDFGNDAGGVPGSDTDDIIDGDPNDPARPNDEDDSDPFRIEIYDLALTKQVGNTDSVLIGDTVSYVINVLNQGNLPAGNVQITDYIPDGFSLPSTATPPWTVSMGAGGTLVTTTLPDTLFAGDTVTLDIQLVFAGLDGVDQYVNSAEISADDGDDEDSTPDQDPDNDAGGQPDSDADDATDGDGTGTPMDDDPDTDSDDQDPASITFMRGAIGSTVFIDSDYNSVQSVLPSGTLEEGIPDVTVQLFLDANQDGELTGMETTPIATTQTDADGAYYFGELLPAIYQVQIPASNFTAMTGPLAGAVNSSPDIASTPLDDETDSDDNGIQDEAGGLVVSPFITIIPGTEPVNEPGSNGNQDVDNGIPDNNGDMTVDFGFVPNQSIGSTVFADLDEDGLEGAGEPGIENVTVELYYDENMSGNFMLVGTQQTDANGAYFFTELLPGDYRVQIPASNFNAGEALNAAQESSPDTPGQSATDSRFDGDDNGLQANPGTVVVSPVINLSPNAEPVDAAPGVGPGEGSSNNMQDNRFDSFGDMTVDFGFVCTIDIETTPDVAICQTATVILRDIAEITPTTIGGTWTSSGNGDFLDVDGNILTAPVQYSTAVAYRPTAEDARRGTVDLTLTTGGDGACTGVTATITVQVLKVDCGSGLWDGE